MRTLEAEVEVEVDFHDVDAMQVTWHGHYVKYFERARCALLRKIGYDYPEMRDSGYLWPIVDCKLSPSFLRKSCRRLRELMPQARAVTFEQSGHHVGVDAREELLGLLRDVVARRADVSAPVADA